MNKGKIRSTICVCINYALLLQAEQYCINYKVGMNTPNERPMTFESATVGNQQFFEPVMLMVGFNNNNTTTTNNKQYTHTHAHAQNKTAHRA